jgi:hypothetical protein
MPTNPSTATADLPTSTLRWNCRPLPGPKRSSGRGILLNSLITRLRAPPRLVLLRRRRQRTPSFRGRSCSNDSLRTRKGSGCVMCQRRVLQTFDVDALEESVLTLTSVVPCCRTRSFPNDLLTILDCTLPRQLTACYYCVREHSLMPFRFSFLFTLVELGSKRRCVLLVSGCISLDFAYGT